MLLQINTVMMMMIIIIIIIHRTISEDTKTIFRIALVFYNKHFPKLDKCMEINPTLLFHRLQYTRDKMQERRQPHLFTQRTPINHFSMEDYSRQTNSELCYFKLR
jgi:hypothetical protein